MSRVIRTNDNAVQASDNVPGAPRATTGSMYDPTIAYLWLDAGLSRPFFRGSDTISHPALCGWLMAVFACACLAAVFVWTDSRMRPTEATAQMERFAENLERVTAIPTKTAREIARVIGQPWYDCNYVTCSAQLKERNLIARAKVSSLLAMKEVLQEVSANQKR